MKSLKDALLKAGIKGTKAENERASVKGRSRTQSEQHQVARNFCEHCTSTQPDVERFNHRNPTTDAQWICVLCADRLMIDDKFRVSNQSDFAKKGTYKREYGATNKDFGQEKKWAKSAPPGKTTGNRSNSGKPGNGNSKSGGKNRKYK